MLCHRGIFIHTQYLGRNCCSLLLSPIILCGTHDGHDCSSEIIHGTTAQRGSDVETYIGHDFLVFFFYRAALFYQPSGDQTRQPALLPS